MAAWAYFKSGSTPDVHRPVPSGHNTHIPKEQPTAPNLNHETYDVATAISLAQSYGALDSNPGATQMRKLVKIVKMMCDPDMEDHLDRASRNFCKIMFDLCLRPAPRSICECAWRSRR